MPGKIHVRARFFRKAFQKHSDQIIPKIDSLSRRVRWKPKDLSAIAVDIGPGSFTGVRIGLAVARTLAQGLEVPLLGIPSLDIAAAGRRSLLENDRLACIARAVPGEVYLGIYRVRGADVSLVRNGAGPLPRNSRGAFQERPWFPAQDGLVLERQGPLAWMSLEEAERRIRAVHMPGTKTVRLEDAPPRPEVLAGLAQWAWSHGDRQTFNRVVPLYLQPSWAERKRLG